MEKYDDELSKLKAAWKGFCVRQQFVSFLDKSFKF